MGCWRDSGLGLFGLGLCGLLAITGCGGESASQPAAPPFQGVELTVAAVGDPAILEAVRVQSGEWERANGARLAIRASSIDPKEARTADVLVFPADRMGDLVDQNALAVLPESAIRPIGLLPVGDDEKSDDPNAPATRADTLDFSDVLSPYRDLVSKYGSDRLALPLGGSCLLLVYRRDAFESEANRKAAEAAGLTLEPPKTWEQFDALARFFHGRDWDGDGQPESGVALALGDDPERLGDVTYLARAASLGQAPDQFSFLFNADTMAPLIGTPPFVEAMSALAALKDYGPKGMENFDAEAARAAFRSGQVALLIDRGERASRWTDPKAPAPVGTAMLPGSPRVYDPERKVWLEPAEPNRPSYLPVGGGWLVAVSAGVPEKEREAAISFLKMLAGPEIAQAIVSDPAFPMVPVRQSHLGLGLPDPRSALGVDSRGWGQAVLETLTAPRVLPGLRVPEADAYLTDLAKARVAVVRGEPADKALEAVAKAWTERNAKLGTERQLWHYRRGLNRLSTAPEPPSRPNH